jgi:hypothetical protein
MTLSEALKVPGVWWVVLKGHVYPSDNNRPTKVEVIEVLEGGKQSVISIDGEQPIRVHYEFHNWDAYNNFWLAWAAIQRSKA